VSDADYVERFYDRISTDPAYRARLLADPVACLCEEFGYTRSPDLRIEVIEQDGDTIVIMIPPIPDAGQNVEQELTRVTEQVFDLLYSSGVAGFFIPDESQKWVLRDMRLAWRKKGQCRSV
jgi:hypothetical protein